MPRTLPVAAQAATGPLSCVLVAALVVSALSLTSAQARSFLLGTLALLGLVACLAVPLRALPSLALVTVVLVPDRIADYSVSPLVTPATLILLLWAVRKLLARATAGPAAPGGVLDRGLRQWLTTCAVLLAALMVPLVVVSPSKRVSVAWALTLVVALALPLMIGDLDEEAHLLRAVLPWLGSAAAAYAVVQGLIQQNVVYTPVYEALGLDELQHWAVYRADSSLGHPLTAGLFFAVVLAFCTGRWLESRQHRFAVMAALNGLAIVATVSRGSYVAAAVAVAVVMLTGLRVQRRHRARLVVVLVMFGLAAAAALRSAAFVERSVSEEGLNSLNARGALPEIAVDTSRAHHWLGGGPASSLDLAAPFNYQHLPIENSYLQLLISVGAPGLVLFLLILVLAAVLAMRRGNLSGIGALVAYATAISGYAALDSRRNLVVLLGVLVMISLQRPAGRDPRTATPTSATSSTPASSLGLPGASAPSPRSRVPVTRSAARLPGRRPALRPTGRPAPALRGSPEREEVVADA